jgi:serine phosphatase RsbU (regulator of sigma subunit)/anti-sigma regulatory factor (Ser/Thr protein kinase)
MIETISSSNRMIYVYTKSRRAADLAPLYAARLTLDIQTRSFENALRGDPALAAAGAAYSNYSLQGMDVITTYAADMRRGDTAATSRIYASPATRQLSANLEHSKVVFDQLAERQSLQTLAARRTSAGRVETSILVIALGGIVLTMLVALLFGKRIVVRLHRLGDNASRLADGIPTIPDQGNDEIGELDRIYREMANRIQESAREHDQVLAELHAERNVANVLQQALMPEIAPIPGLRLDTAYATPAEGAQIGGDWFDVFAISDRLVGMSVGDVTGHGLRAAATMGFVRQAIRIVARLDTDPSAVMDRVNHVVCEESGSIVTAFFGVFDRERGSLAYALAGHGPPMVAAADGTISLLAGEGMLLGLERGTRFTTHVVELAPGDGLVLYTDGIVEAERDYLKGMRDLERAVRAEFRDPSVNMADGIQHRIFNEAAPRDDSAVLVVKIAELAPPASQPRREWSFDARDQGTAWRVKRELLNALAALGALAPEPAVAEMVFGELLSNVVRHTPGTARVFFTIENGHVVLSVEDRGRPFPTEGTVNDGHHRPDGDAESGRGLFLIGALCRRIAIAPTASGKCLSAVLPVANADRTADELTETVSS